jgi:hypothetical protein
MRSNGTPRNLHVAQPYRRLVAPALSVHNCTMSTHEFVATARLGQGGGPNAPVYIVISSVAPAADRESIIRRGADAAADSDSGDRPRHAVVAPSAPP